MTKINQFYVALALYSLLSVASQYGSSITVDMSWLFAGLFLPLSAFTIIPLLDCSRSFTQHYGEQADVEQSRIYKLLLIIPFVIATICVIAFGLPLPILVGALVATNVGGYVDIAAFKAMRRISDKPYVRMSVSNGLATVIGSMAFFLTAFTNIIPHTLAHVGIEYVNTMANPDTFSVVKSALLQSSVIWVCALTIGTALDKLRVRFLA